MCGEAAEVALGFPSSRYTYIHGFHSRYAPRRSSEAATAAAVAKGIAAREEASSVSARLEEASRQMLALREASDASRSALMELSSGEVEGVRQQLGQVGWIRSRGERWLSFPDAVPLSFPDAVPVSFPDTVPVSSRQALAEAEALRQQLSAAAGDMNDLQFSLDQQRAQAAAQVSMDLGGQKRVWI